MPATIGGGEREETHGIGLNETEVSHAIGRLRQRSATLSVDQERQAMRSVERKIGEPRYWRIERRRDTWNDVSHQMGIQRVEARILR